MRLSHLCFHWGFALKATVTCSLSKFQTTGAINFTVMTILPARGICLTMLQLMHLSRPFNAAFYQKPEGKVWH